MFTIYRQKDMICDNVEYDSMGRLRFANMSISSLAEKYGTPLYLYDEERIRENCRAYTSAAKDAFFGRSKILYASKAA